MLDLKRIALERQKEGELTPAMRKKMEQSVVRRYSAAEAFLVGSEVNSLKGTRIFDMVSGNLRKTLYVLAADTDARRLTAAHGLSAQWILHRLGMICSRTGDLKIAGVPSPASALADDVLEFYAVGWCDEGERVAREIWTTQREERLDLQDLLYGNPKSRETWPGGPTIYERDINMWMTTMAFVDQDLWRPLGYAPNPDDLGPHYMLAERWRDPDPIRVRNALQAMRERNLGLLMIRDVPEGNQRSIVSKHLLFWDYDVQAIQMARKWKGLAPVDGVESYLGHPPDPLEPLPFVRDPVMWPLYEKLCGMMGAEPVTPEGVPVIEAELDVERMEIVQR